MLEPFLRSGQDAIVERLARNRDAGDGAQILDDRGGRLGPHPQAGPLDDPRRDVARDAQLDVEIVLRQRAEPYAKQSSPLFASRHRLPKVVLPACA